MPEGVGQPLPSPQSHPARLEALDATPDAGLAKGILFRLGLLRTARTWGSRFVIRSPAVPKWLAWRIRHGDWERAETALGLRHLDFALPLLELGGGVGMTSCTFNRWLADPQAHVVVEMDDVARGLLEANRRLNGAGFTILAAMVGYDGAESRVSRTAAHFDAHNRHDASGAHAQVPVLGLREVADQAGFRRFCLVMDIEGAEAKVVERDADVLRERVARLIFEVHPEVLGAQGALAVVRQVEALGFRLDDWAASTMAFTNTRLA
jgi:FkbM family methyltransferase